MTNGRWHQLNLEEDQQLKGALSLLNWALQLPVRLFVAHVAIFIKVINKEIRVSVFTSSAAITLPSNIIASSRYVWNKSSQKIRIDSEVVCDSSATTIVVLKDDKATIHLHTEVLQSVLNLDTDQFIFYVIPILFSKFASSLFLSWESRLSPACSYQLTLLMQSFLFL